MKKPVKFLLVLTAVVLIVGALLARAGSDSQGPYLGQKTPGTVPELFAPGIVSTGLYERDVAVSPDGREIIFGVIWGKVVTIMSSRLEGGEWTTPEVVPFALDFDYFHLEPCFSPDGKTLYFLSTRAPAGEKPKPGWGHQGLWASDKRGDGSWGEPYDLGFPINTKGAFQYFPSMTRDGTLYFTRQVPGGESAVWRSRRRDGRFSEPEKLPEAVNRGGKIYNACVSPDENYLVGCVPGRTDTVTPGASEYYVFFRSADGGWNEGANLGEGVNFRGSEAISPSISPDGKYLFFAAARKTALDRWKGRPMAFPDLRELAAVPQNGLADIYWVDTRVIEELEKSIRKPNPGK